MSKKTLVLAILVIFSFVAMAQSPVEIQKKKDKDKGKVPNIIAGRNVNMVPYPQLSDPTDPLSSLILETGDPYLQRQNEPSLAVSTRNPMHLLAGANDYRTVDFPVSEGELPGKLDGAIAAGDAWLGVFKSFDGGESWISSMLPGYPHSIYHAAADPVVRAGANGLFFYSGIAFERAENGLSTVFIARFIDNNNKEGGDTIEYIDTTIIDLGDGLNFIDKPWIAVDVPRTGDTVNVNGQDVARFNVFIIYSVFTGKKSEIRYSESKDSGQSWSNPAPLAMASGQGYFDIQAKKEKGIFQGASVAFSPKDGSIKVAWRQFDKDSSKNKGAIYFAKSKKKGNGFEKAKKVDSIKPFDQGSSTATFRTNSYPTMAIDEDGRIYLAWADRKKGGGDDDSDDDSASVSDKDSDDDSSDGGKGKQLDQAIFSSPLPKMARSGKNQKK